MEIQKRLKLNNNSLEEFDKLMNFHLDEIEELEIDEVNINNKLYNLISLCTNLKQLVIKGDLRSNVNKIFFNICYPENIEILILESVKLPTNKVFSKFSNLTTISLNNINFSDLISFLNKIPNPEKVFALNLTNVDFGKRSISICNKFSNLKYLNLDNIKNCLFDNFDFIHESPNMKRFDFYNNQIEFEQIDGLLEGNFSKRILVDVKTNEKCNIMNRFKANDEHIALAVNSCDLEKAIKTVNFSKLTNLSIILSDFSKLGQYIKTFKTNRIAVTLAIKDICYFSKLDAEKIKERLNLQCVNVLESPKNLKLSSKQQCYSIDDYCKIRDEFDKIKEMVIYSDKDKELDRFKVVYNYFKNNIKYTTEETDLKDVFIEKKSCYDFYALAINSCLKNIGFETKVIRGAIIDEENHLWNQVKIYGNWYNFDLAYELRAKENKNFLQYAFKKDLLLDEQFYKTHTPNFDSKPERCSIGLQEINNLKLVKVDFIKRFYLKIVSLFKFNKAKALPEPDNDKK